MSAFDRSLLIGSSSFFTSVATLLLFMPQYFYATVPGVAVRGPMNVHLLGDIGIAYAALALGLAFAVTDLTRAKFTTVAAAFYLGGHSALHIGTVLANGSARGAWIEAPGVYVPSVLAAIIALRFKHITR